jgi:serine/threonine protein kinase
MTDDPTLSRISRALAGRYRVERVLGAGGMATVYLADDVRHARKVAIKVLREDLSASIGGTRFQQEIEIAARLQHPHILPLLDSGEADGLLYYVMPLVEGRSLRERLDRDGLLSANEAVRILTGVVDALAYAHRQGVVHRDIKPDNIMLTGRHAVVADFGIAKATHDVAAARGVTATGLALGTPTYMSPEQATADPSLDHRSDIYALGVTAYEMLAGRPPFVYPLAQQVVVAHITETPHLISVYAPAVPPELERIVMRCLEKLPNDRYQTADRLLEDLEAESPASGELPRRPARAPELRGFRRTAIIAGAVALAGSGVAYGIYRRSDPGSIVVGNTTQLTSNPGLEIQPSVSPNGREVAYAAGQLGYVHILIQPIDGGRARALTTDSLNNEWAPRWSHDGSRILYLNSRGAFSAPALGGPPRQEADGREGSASETLGSILWAGWSPDDKQIAFVRGDSLLVHDTGANHDRLVSAGGDLHSCDWSPDGGWFACVTGNSVSVTAGRRVGNAAPSRVIVVSAQGGPRWTLEGTKSDLSPVWYPDGKRLLFVSNRQGKSDVYAQLMSRSGTGRGAPQRLTIGLNAQAIGLSGDGMRLVYSAYEARANAWALPIPVSAPVSVKSAVQLTSGNQYLEAVSISRSGRWLIYDSNVHGSTNLYRQSITGGDPEQMTTDTTSNWRGDLSSDDKELAFMSFRTGTRDIFVQPLDGRPMQQVTASPAQETFPTWSPDGSALAFFTIGPFKVFSVRRGADGTWGTPVWRADGRLAHWSPDGQSLAYDVAATGEIGVVGAFSGSPRVVYKPIDGSSDPRGECPLFSADGTTLYFKSHDARGVSSIWSVPVAGGRPRLLVRFDVLTRQSNWPELSTDGKRFYFTLDDSQSDLYVVSLNKR